MVFVNERISHDDALKYHLDAINEDFFMGAGAVKLWTIDREKDVYLRRMKSNREEPKEHEFSFYWKGSLFHINLKRKGTGEKTAEGWKGWTHWSWNGMRRPTNPRDQLLLDTHRAEIMADFKEALTTYKDIGLLSEMIEYNVTFDF